MDFAYSFENFKWKSELRRPLCSFFWKIWRALFSCNTRFEIRPFALLPTIFYVEFDQFFWDVS